MIQTMMLKIRGVQHYDDQDPDVIELFTEGTLEQDGDCWRIAYEETELTGLKGTTTTFEVWPDRVILDRTGSLSSRMTFREGERFDSLYQIDVGAFMIGVTARRIKWKFTEAGGSLDVIYKIDIENSACGTVHYHIEAKPPVKDL